MPGLWVTQRSPCQAALSQVWEPAAPSKPSATASRGHQTGEVLWMLWESYESWISFSVASPCRDTHLGLSKSKGCAISENTHDETQGLYLQTNWLNEKSTTRRSESFGRPAHLYRLDLCTCHFALFSSSKERWWTLRKWAEVIPCWMNWT